METIFICVLEDFKMNKDQTNDYKFRDVTLFCSNRTRDAVLGVREFPEKLLQRASQAQKMPRASQSGKQAGRTSKRMAPTRPAPPTPTQKTNNRRSLSASEMESFYRHWKNEFDYYP